MNEFKILKDMIEKREFDFPIAYGIAWDELSAPNLAKRKELETIMLDAIVNFAEAHGATDIEIGEIHEASDGSGKVVTLRAHGDIDSQMIMSSLKRAMGGFEK